MSKFIYNKLNGSELLRKAQMDGMKVSTLSLDKQKLFEKITSMLLDTENLLYYASQRVDCSTLEDIRKNVAEANKTFNLEERIDDVLENLGWIKDKINLNSTVLHGDIGEFMMSVVMDELGILNTVISKVSLKTAPGSPAHGNDNVYYDYNNEILYFGESKFYSSAKDAFNRCYDSLKDHSDDDQEFKYIRNHTNCFIAENGKTRDKIISKLENARVGDVVKKYVSFVMCDDIFSDIDFENLLNDFSKSNEEKKFFVNESIIVFLPVISKTEFLEYFKEHLPHAK